MGRLDNVPEQNSSDLEADDPRTAEAVLRSMAQDLRTLQRDLLTELSQDISRLQAEKSRLVNDIERLQQQQQSLQANYEVALSRQQLAQQQAWAKQLALVLANHLQAALSERLNQTIGNAQGQGMGGLPPISGAATNAENTYRLLASLDETVNRTFASLRHDITSYQSTLAQQLERMHAMGQQGEAILDVLVRRLSQQLQLEAARSQGELRESPSSSLPAELPYNPNAGAVPTASLTPPALGSSTPYSPPSEWAVPRPEPAATMPPRPTNPAAREPEAESSPVPPLEPPARAPRSRKAASIRTGLILVLLATLAVALHHVTVAIVGNSSRLFGGPAIGGYLPLDRFSSALLLLWLRMVVVVPLMVWLARFLHPPTLPDIRAFAQSRDRRMLWGIVGSGIFLFLSQVFLYLAIGQIGPGVAVTTLFLYPVGTLLLGWLLFGDRPTLPRLGAAVAILVGVGLAVFPIWSNADRSPQGVVMAVLAGITFALYLVAMQIGARKLHPVPVSLLQFAAMFVLSSAGLIMLGVEVDSNNWGGLIGCGIGLGLLTVASYLLNHFGIRIMGAARATIVAASAPVLTALLAFVVIPGSLTALSALQILGILAVTLGGTALSLERMVVQNRAARQAKLREQGN
ncbi:MAG: EamA family transporter [Synechococcales cyanobacterium M58_A2018_015]|nr:EamA family transporter [Synechococcales cyanobacterium M58_A2018_015]